MRTYWRAQVMRPKGVNKHGTIFSPSINKLGEKIQISRAGGAKLDSDAAVPTWEPSWRKRNEDSPTRRTMKAVLYGGVISLILIPMALSFCQIIFRDAFYQSTFPRLVRLMLFSCCIHQVEHL